MSIYEWSDDLIGQRVIEESGITGTIIKRCMSCNNHKCGIVYIRADTDRDMEFHISTLKLKKVIPLPLPG